MFTVNLIGFCVLLEIFSGGCEPEVDRDGSHVVVVVVVSVSKRETAIYLKGGAEDGGRRCRVDVVTPYKNMHSVHNTL